MVDVCAKAQGYPRLDWNIIFNILFQWNNQHQVFDVVDCFDNDFENEDVDEDFDDSDLDDFDNDNEDGDADDLKTVK